MRTGRWVAGVAVAALVLVMSGCGGSAPEITDAQVAGWQQLAERTIPAAQSITVEAQHTGSDMFGNYSTYVAVNADFATNADLAASEQALADLAGTVVAVVGGKRLKFEAHYEGADAVCARNGVDVAGLSRGDLLELSWDLAGLRRAVDVALAQVAAEVDRRSAPDDARLGWRLARASAPRGS